MNTTTSMAIPTASAPAQIRAAIVHPSFADQGFAPAIYGVLLLTADGRRRWGWSGASHAWPARR